MKKLSLGIIAVLLTSTTFAFGGAGTDREGRMVNPDTHNVSRYAKTTIAPNKGASQRNFRYSFKRQIKLSRKQTREQKSQLLDKRFYRGSRTRAFRPERVETEVQKNLRLWRAKRMAR